MKRKVIPFLLFALPLNIFAQAWIYHPLVQDSTYFSYWSYRTNPELYRCRSNSYILNGDTLLNGKIYKKGWVGQPLPSYYFREDSKKVYYTANNLPFAPLPEQLIYDFGVSVGDTIKTGFVGENSVYKAIVIKVDSMLTKAGYRKRIKFTPLNYGWSASCDVSYRNEWVEGLGSSIDLISTYFNGSHGPCEFSIMLNVVVLKTDTVFGSIVDCKYSDIRENQALSESTKIYSYKSKLIIENSNEYRISTVYLCDINGSVIIKNEINGESTLNIDISNIPEGLYVVELISNKGEVIVKKIMVQK